MIKALKEFNFEFNMETGVAIFSLGSVLNHQSVFCQFMPAQFNKTSIYIIYLNSKTMRYDMSLF